MLIIYKKIRWMSLSKLSDYDYLCYNILMAKKKFHLNIKVAYDAPVTLTFVIVCAIIFLINMIFMKGGKALGFEKIFASPTNQAGALPFIPSAPLSYVRLLFYIFGADFAGLSTGFSSGAASLFFTSVIVILLLGPGMEERYGSVIIGIMIFVSALFSGVLNACFCETTLVGAAPLVFMMLFLNAFISFSKKKIELPSTGVMVTMIILMQLNGAGAVKIIICIAGGLCGSLFAFLTSPKMKAEKKNNNNSTGSTKKSSGLLNRAEKLAYAEELDKNSPRNKKPSDDDGDETTVVGTLKF